MRKPKLLLLITKANFGGAQRYVRDLAASLNGEVDVLVAFGGHGALETELKRLGVPTLSLPSLARDVSPLLDLSSFAAIFKLLRRERPDVLHVNSSKAGFIGAVAGRLARVPRIVFTAHGFAFEEPRHPIARLFFKILTWIIMIAAHRTIAVSSAVANRVRSWPLIAPRLSMIRNALPPVAFLTRERAREKLRGRGSGKNELWIGTVAELHPVKGLAYLIEAFAALAPFHPGLRLVIVGEGEERETLKTLAEHLSVAEQVMFTGFIKDAAALLPAFDIFTLPSRFEAFGYALLEAGAAGLPVVASSVGGIPEIVEDRVSGLLVRKESPHDLATALRLLIADEALRGRLGTALKERVLTTFSFDDMVRATRSVYEDRL